MKNEVPHQVAADMLAKCGRHCCICRRFRPTMLQVHHIVPRNKGGTDDPDNLIVVCLTCHSDTHTHRPFTRRFTPDEQKQHREQVFKLVGTGDLVPPEDVNVLDGLLAGNEDAMLSKEVFVSVGKGLSQRAKKILIAAAEGAGREQGLIFHSISSSGFQMRAGTTQIIDNHFSDRERAEAEHAIDQLMSNDLIDEINDDVFRLTHHGYLVADECISALPGPNE